MRVCRVTSPRVRWQVSELLELARERRQAVESYEHSLVQLERSLDVVSDAIKVVLAEPALSVGSGNEKWTSASSLCQRYLQACKSAEAFLTALSGESAAERKLYQQSRHAALDHEFEPSSADRARTAHAAYAEAHRKLRSRRNQLRDMVQLAPEIAADPRCAVLIASSLSLPLEEERLLSVDYVESKAVTSRQGSHPIIETTEIATGQRVVLKKFAASERHRLEREVSAMLQLRSPYVLAPQLVFSDADSFYLQLQRCDGGSLADWIIASKTQARPLSEMLTLIRKMALGLQAVHSVGIVHGDVKPSNVLLHAGDPLWADFEFSDGSGMSTLTVVPMSFGYVAPEVKKGGKPTTHSDLFSFGATLKEMLQAFAEGQRVEQRRASGAGSSGAADCESVPVSLEGVVRGLQDPALAPTQRPRLAELLSLPLFVADLADTKQSTSDQRLERVSGMLQQQRDADGKRAQVPVTVDRKQPLNSLDIFSRMDLRAALRVQFAGESGIDMGGPTTEFYRCLFESALRNDSWFTTSESLTCTLPVPSLPCCRV